jgi:putative endonuclease
MFIVYILKSLKTGKHYIGQTDNILDRIKRHNSGRSKATKNFAPWELIYSEEYSTRPLAFRREQEIKSYKGGIKFKKLLGLWKDN